MVEAQLVNGNGSSCHALPTSGVGGAWQSVDVQQGEVDALLDDIKGLLEESGTPMPSRLVSTHTRHELRS